MVATRVFVFVLAFLAAVSSVEAATATWNRNPETNVVGYVLSYGTQPGVHTVSIDVGNVTTYQFFPPAGQRYYVVVQAYDTGRVLSPKSAEVLYDAGVTANQAPTLQQPSNQTSLQNAAVSLALIGSDPEASPLSYSASGLPAGLSVNQSTGLISGTVTTAGTFNVVATVSDGSLTASRNFTWTVTTSTGTSTTVTLSPVDTTLSIDNNSRSTDSRLILHTFPANRPYMAALLKFDLSQIPANATIQSASLQLSLNKADTNTSEPTYTVTLHQIVNRNPNVAVATGVNYDGVNAWSAAACCTPPMAQGDISAAQSSLAVDRVLGPKTWDALTMVRAWHATPATNYGMLLNPDLTKLADRYRNFGSMEATASERPFLRVTYTTGGGTGGDTTQPTASLTAPASGATVSGASVTVSATASDNVGVVGVQFQLDGISLGAEDTTSPYSTVWNTTTAINGSHVLTAVARDAAGNSRTTTAVTVTVSNTAANRAPTLTQPANQTSAEGSAVTMTLQGSDPDNNPLTYSATGLPAGLTVNATTGVISGTPGFTSAGAYTVNATASDGSLSQSRTFTWTVTNTNRPPTLTRPADQVSVPGATVSLQLSGSDPDGTAVTYQASGLPPGLTVNASTGVIAGTLGANSGSYTVTATVSDGQLTASQSFAWAVNATTTNSDEVPVLGDFDGDGRNDPATFRDSTGAWRVWTSSNGYALANIVTWGQDNDIPVTGDYDGDRRTDFAVYRPSTGTWFVMLSSTNNQSRLQIQWGDQNDRPIAIDYDNDGRVDMALPRNGGFTILLSRSNYTTSTTVR